MYVTVLWTRNTEEIKVGEKCAYLPWYGVRICLLCIAAQSTLLTSKNASIVGKLFYGLQRFIEKILTPFTWEESGIKTAKQEPPALCWSLQSRVLDIHLSKKEVSGIQMPK